MNIVNRVLELINEMAFSRNQFISRLRDGILGGAIGEYMCREIALGIGEQDMWSNEVERILRQVHKYMDKKKIATTFKNRKLALSEAMAEASTFQEKIIAAKTKVGKYYPKKKKEILKLDIDIDILFPRMIKEYLPKYVSLLKYT